MSSTESAPECTLGAWGGASSLLAVATAANGGQGRGFRADGGAVAFVPPRDWLTGEQPVQQLLVVDRIDLDGRSSITAKNGKTSAKAAVDAGAPLQRSQQQKPVRMVPSALASAPSPALAPAPASVPARRAKSDGRDLEVDRTVASTRPRVNRELGGGDEEDVGEDSETSSAGGEAAVANGSAAPGMADGKGRPVARGAVASPGAVELKNEASSRSRGGRGGHKSPGVRERRT